MAIPKTPRPSNPLTPVAGLKALPQQTATKPNVAKRRIENRKLSDRVYDPKKPRQTTQSSPVIQAAVAGYADNTVAGAASIAELARALKNDVDLIFEFVYNNIEFIPTYGSQKGALGCLIDGMGNSFDQSELLVELLREAGYTADYQLGELEMLEADAAAFFGTDTNIWAIYNLLGVGGIPADTYWSYPDWYIRFTHCWVKVDIGGTDYHFDPSLKSYTTVSGMNLATALSYSQSSFMSDATSGATITSDYVQDINRSNIRDNLGDMTDNLISYIQSNDPDATINEVLGGRTIDPLVGFVRDTSHPELRSSTTPTTWTTDIPDSYKTTLNVYYWDSTTPIDETFYSKDIHGKRMTLTFNGSREAELRLDGTLIASSAAQGIGTWSSVWLEVEHPYGSTFADEGHWQTVWAEQPYLIGHAWGNAGAKLAELHRQREGQARFDGGSNTDEDTIGEALAGVFHTWNALKSRACDMLNRMSKCKTVLHHQTGLVCNYDDKQPLMDLGGIVWASGALDNDWDNVDTNDTALAMHGIAFEAAALEQVTGIKGVCSTTLLDLANLSGDKIYDASSSNWTGTVEPALTNYTSTEKGDIKSWWIDAGWRVALPEDGDLSQGNWDGYGYFAISPYYGAIGIINGLKGTGPEDEDPLWRGDKQHDPNISEAERTWGVPKAGDPVSMFSGAFQYDRADFSVGSQSTTPYGIEFRRQYKSSDGLVNGPVGLGWSHNHQISASIRSDALSALASLSPIQGAAGIVAMFVTVSLYGDLDKPMDKWVTASLVNKWLIDQSTNNIVRISSSGEAISFVKLPDGSYARPLNNASDLELSGGTYIMTNPQGVKFNFNSDGDISTIVYPFGVIITYTYTSGKLTSVTNGLGRTLTFTYTGERITSISDGNSRTVGFSYDGAGNLDAATDPEGEGITYEYDSNNRMIKYFMPANPTSAILVNTYDTLGRVKEQKDVANNVTKFYIAGPRAEEENPEGDSQVWYFNRRGFVVKHIDQLENETVTAYDGLGRVIKVTAPEGNSTEYQYDSNNNVSAVTFKAKSGSGLSDIVNEFTYNSTWNKVATAEDGRGNLTTYTYDGTNGNLTKIERPTIGMDTPTIEFTYNSRGQILTRTDETDIVTEYAYDASKEELDSITVDKGTGRLNLKTEFYYDTVGNMTSIKDPRGNTTTFEYDDNRRRTKITAPSPFSYQTKFTYDENGNRTKVERETGDGGHPWQTVTTAYGIDDLVTSVTNASGDVTGFTYTNLRKLWKITDAESRVTEISYNEMGRVYTVKDPSSTIAETRTYTDNGLLASVKDASNNTTSYEYDGFDRLKKTTYPNSKYEQLTYDANGNVTQFRTRNADLIDFTYDVLNRVTEKDPDGMPTVTYTYDLAGRKTQVSTPTVGGNPASGDFDYSYDTAGRLIGEEYPDGKDVDYELDENGNITKLTYPDGFYVEYVYDKLNLLTDIKLDGDTNSAIEFTYDKLSRRTQITYENGVVTDYGFEWDDDMDSLEHTFDVGSTPSSVAFTYAFNDVHELVSQSVDDSGFMWHPALASTVNYGTANNMNQYPTVGGTTQTYNNNGCLTDDGSIDFTYDTENQLIEADDGSTVTGYIYDPLRRQNQKEVGSTRTRFIYAAFQMIMEYDGSGSVQKKYVYGSSMDEVLIELDGSEDKTYLHHDRIGSIVATTDESGDVVNTYAYSPFGESNSMSGTTFGFTGQRYDSETGLYYYKNRYYSPKAGRFLQPDPLGYVDSLNPYQYALNDPTGFTDPFGLDSQPNNLWGNEPPRDPFREWGYVPTWAEIAAYLQSTPAGKLTRQFGESLRNWAVTGLKNFEAGANGPIYDGLIEIAKFGILLATLGGTLGGIASFFAKSAGGLAKTIGAKKIDGWLPTEAEKQQLWSALKNIGIDGDTGSGVYYFVDHYGKIYVVTSKITLPGLNKITLLESGH